MGYEETNIFRCIKVSGELFKGWIVGKIELFEEKSVKIKTINLAKLYICVWKRKSKRKLAFKNPFIIFLSPFVWAFFCLNCFSKAWFTTHEWFWESFSRISWISYKYYDYQSAFFLYNFRTRKYHDVILIILMRNRTISIKLDFSNSVLQRACQKRFRF